MDYQLIKELKLNKEELKQEIEDLDKEVIKKTKQLEAKKRCYTRLKYKIYDLEYNDYISVSDHALIRYLERVKNIDIDILRKEILNEETIKNAISINGHGKIKHKGFTVCLKNNKVTTIF